MMDGVGGVSSAGLPIGDFAGRISSGSKPTSGTQVEINFGACQFV